MSAASEIVLAPISPAEAEAVAQLIALHARSLDDGELLADILGLDEGVRTWNSDYNRVMRLADSIGGPR